jgi:opacity protein-like surface antigen
MRRFALAAALLAAAAAPPARATEGVYLTIDAGYGLFNKDDFKSKIAPQVGTDPATGQSNAALLAAQMSDGAAFGLHLGYNIAGHVGFEGSFSFMPRDVFKDTRGGLGIGSLDVRWFPLQGLVRPGRPFDLSLIAGIGYALLGGGGITDASGKKIANTSRGFDGTAVNVGATAELYPAKWVSLGVTPRLTWFDPLRYFTDFDNRDQGGQIPLSGHPGGSLFTILGSITFHFAPLPD